jgi:asparagine synthetase B (glutamine-hydrolysing)
MIRELLEQEIEKSSSDKEVAILLSGGVDSLSVLFAARRLNKQLQHIHFI